MSKAVAHYTDGTIRKGAANDFFPNRDSFHMIDHETGQSNKIDIPALKALFFVRDYAGNPAYSDQQDVERAGLGRRIEVVFKDGETVVGYTQGFSPTRAGFFLTPADPQSNNERIYVVLASTKSTRFL